MNKLISLAFAIGVSASFSGCGSMNDAVNATKSVPDKIDATNNEVKKSNDGIKTTTDEVKKTNAGLGAMKDAVDKTNDGVEATRDEVHRTNESLGTMVNEVRKTNTGIAKTNSAVHNQTLAVSLAEMMKPENTQYLFPPTGMLPSGQVFANEATEEEIVQLIAVYLTEIETAGPEATDRDPATGEWKPDVVARIDRSKKVKFTAASVIAGLAPDDTINEMIQTQIDHGGRYEKTAMSVLMLRYMFISELKMKNDLLTQPLSSPGLIAEAVKLTESLEAISKLPYADKISLKTTGMLVPADNYDLQLDPSLTLTFWKKINRAFDKDLLDKYKDPASPEAGQIVELRAKVRAKLAAATSAQPAADLTSQP